MISLRPLLLSLTFGASFLFSIAAEAQEACLVASTGYTTVKVRTLDGKTITWPTLILVSIEKKYPDTDSAKVLRFDNNEIGFVYTRFLRNPDQCERTDGGEDHQPVDPNGNNSGNDSGENNRYNPPISAEAADPFQCFQTVGAARASECNRNAMMEMTVRGRHTIGYGPARERLFQYVDVKTSGNGEKYVQSIYSKDTLTITSPGIPKGSFNVEHTWPQSYLKKYPNFDQSRADMYHIFSVESKINGARGNTAFAECPEPDQSWTSHDCAGGFEPPPEQKGITARAMFYMAVAYKMPIDDRQEKTLREWAAKYPVTAYERERARKVAEIQGNVNPFIEHPEWVEIISNF